MHTNKTYIVTGAASGIGAETTRHLQAQGAKVIGVDRNEAVDADSFFQVDMSDPTSIDALVAGLPEGVNGLANIAGVPPTAPAPVVMKVNLVGLRHLTNALIPKMADAASIVNIASLVGAGWQKSLDQVRAALEQDFTSDIEGFCEAEKLADDGRSYFLTKEALIAWTIQNRWTWRERGIRMNTVSPGPVETPILGDFLQTLGERAKEDARLMERPGTAQDIAPVIAFMLSSESYWIRGANIPVDGGMAAHILASSVDL